MIHLFCQSKKTTKTQQFLHLEHLSNTKVMRCNSDCTVTVLIFCNSINTNELPAGFVKRYHLKQGMVAHLNQPEQTGGGAAISTIHWQRRAIWDMNGDDLPVSRTAYSEGNRRFTDRCYRLAGWQKLIQNLFLIAALETMSFYSLLVTVYPVAKL